MFYSIIENVNFYFWLLISFQWDDRGSDRNSSDRSPRQSPAWVPVQTVVQLSKLVSNSALRIIVHFLYTGTIFCRECHLPTVELSELKQAAEFLELPELQTYVTNLMNKEEFLNNDLSQQYLQVNLLSVIITLVMFSVIYVIIAIQNFI